MSRDGEVLEEGAGIKGDCSPMTRQHTHTSLEGGRVLTLVGLDGRSCEDTSA